MTAAAVIVEDREKILKDVGEAIKLQQWASDFSCQWLPGDASNRFYGRIFLKDEAKPLILMVMNAPEAFKSEEVTGADESKNKELPFVAIGKKLFAEKVRVPEILYVDSAHRFLLTEDMGDELLYERRQKESALSWYEKALEELVKIQKVSPFSPVKERSFTKDLLHWETEHFVEYALLKRDKKIPEGALKELRNFFGRVVGEMATSPFGIVHRDYHSKNLMILEKENRVGVIDFQDALMGPPTYDLASLLRDSYVTFSEDEEERLIAAYEKFSAKKLDRRLYGVTSIQRNLKAAGRFYYIFMVKGRDTHLPYVKPTLKRVFKTLKDLKEYQILSILEGCLHEEAS